MGFELGGSFSQTRNSAAPHGWQQLLEVKVALKASLWQSVGNHQQIPVAVGAVVAAREPKSTTTTRSVPSCCRSAAITGANG